ncbi:MAG: FAD-dependent oxidoreductase [Gammaproteobacteria bacterium]|nr:FAD-dependent oxidoreductase [Gammaproteobacteria bacterium]
MQLDNVKTVAIIGAGVAGVTTAKTLLADGLECTVFERNDRLGGVWADGYSNFGVQVQKELYEFPDWPLPKEIPNFTPGPVLQQYLADYAAHFGVTSNIRLNSEVVRLTQRANGNPGWVVTYRVGDAELDAEFDLVVVCIGLYSNTPNVPVFANQDTFDGSVIHNSALKSRDQVKGKRVAVVGFGKSATDAALEAAAVAAQTSIIFRNAHWPVPQKLAGILPFKWGMLHRLTSTLAPTYRSPSTLERVVHGIGEPVVWLFWRLVEILLFFQFQLGSRFGTRLSLVPTTPIERDCFGESTMVPRPAFYQGVRDGAIRAYRTEISEFTPNGVRLKSGEQLDLDVVIMATGWRTDYSFFPETVVRNLNMEDDGYYLYRHLIHPDVPNMAFVGCNAATFESITTYSLQARWLAELLKGKHRLPSRQTMSEEIKAIKEWKRQRMPFSSSRGARILLHQLHYHDELLRDIGANPKRKTGFFAPLKELIDPYEPNDYRSIVSGEWLHGELRTR